MKKLFLGALILSSLVISGCDKDSGRSDDPKSINYINPELTNQGKSANIDVMDVYGTKKKEEKKN